VRCWGANFTGQVGDNTNAQRPRPVKVKNVGGVGVLAGITQISAFGYHTCARQSDGDAFCWGANSSGQGGDTTLTNPRLAPVAVDLSGVTSIATGQDHACAVSGSATWCFGNNDFAELGTGASFGNHPTPGQVQG
jgi:alpha-tubulin suppressor-like RCC1 family protein